MTLRYTTDGTEPTAKRCHLYTADSASKNLKIKVFGTNGRAGRTVGESVNVKIVIILCNFV
ncbi:MAG: chitobiase/beta-hexosaminidase C-terminal domain-containing protein [Spirosomataceae bacterium]